MSASSIACDPPCEASVCRDNGCLKLRSAKAQQAQPSPIIAMPAPSDAPIWRSVDCILRFDEGRFYTVATEHYGNGLGTCTRKVDVTDEVAAAIKTMLEAKP